MIIRRNNWFFLFLTFSFHLSLNSAQNDPLGPPVLVKIDLENILRVADKSPAVLLEMDINMFWQKNDFNDTDFQPQILLANLDESMRDPMVSPDQNLYDRPDGSKQLTTRIVAFFSQVFSFSDFPFDSQKFRVILEAEVGVQYYLYENEEHSHIPRSSQLTTHEWFPVHHMTTNSISSKEITYFEGFKNVSEFEMEFRLRRDSGTYVVTYVVPGLFAVFVSTSQVFLNLEKYFSVRAAITVWSLVLLANIQVAPFSVVPRGDLVNYLEVFGLCNYILMITNFCELLIAQWFEAHGRRNWRRGLDYTARWMLPSLIVLVNVALFLYYPGSSWRALVIWISLASVFVLVVMVYIAHRKIINMEDEKWE